jgi:hydroxyacylglutathione hydrolase
MFLKQFYLEGLGHASYLLGSDETGEGLVFDSRRDVQTYLAQAREQGLGSGTRWTRTVTTTTCPG